MDDLTAVITACEQARWAPDGPTEISDGTARTIGALYHDGSRFAMEFVSTGAITSPTRLWRALFPDYDRLRPAERTVADFMGTYLTNAGRRGTVTGWADRWVA